MEFVLKGLAGSKPEPNRTSRPGSEDPRSEGWYPSPCRKARCLDKAVPVRVHPAEVDLAPADRVDETAQVVPVLRAVAGQVDLEDVLSVAGQIIDQAQSRGECVQRLGRFRFCQCEVAKILGQEGAAGWCSFLALASSMSYRNPMFKENFPQVIVSWAKTAYLASQRFRR